MAKHMGAGWSGTRGRPKLQKDLIELADKAKRRKKLERTVSENQKRQKQGKPARTISERDANKIVDKYRSSTQKIRRLQAKAADMRDRANKVDRSGTGNKKAAATYRQVAKEYLKRAAALRGKK